LTTILARNRRRDPRLAERHVRRDVTTWIMAPTVARHHQSRDQVGGFYFKDDGARTFNGYPVRITQQIPTIS
jgi:hypothetical protein